MHSWELNCLLNIGSFPFCPFTHFLFIPVFSPKGIKVKYSVNALLDVEERDGRGEEEELSKVAS